MRTRCRRLVLFGHHFAAVTDAGPLIGPVLAAQFGYAPRLTGWLSASVSPGLPGMSGLMDYWYHFAIMFEALFILTTIDTGTRVARS